MSDTLVITVCQHDNRPGSNRMLYKAVRVASDIAGMLSHEALSGEPRLLLRGCVSAGYLAANDNFLIGPAIDEASEFFERADGPFIWLAPSAMEVSNRHSETFLERLTPFLMLPYRVPLKSGKRIETLAFSHFCVTSRTWSADRDAVLHELRRGGQETARKLAHTRRFFRHLDRVRTTEEWKAFLTLPREPNLDDLTPRQRLATLMLKAGVPVLEVSRVFRDRS
jgi:hypothetical protein